MGIFKKSQATYIERMELLTNVTVTEEKVLATLQYSQNTFKPEDIPKLLSDVMQLYALVKPILDKKSEEAEKEKTDEEKLKLDDTPIDLSNIPF